MVVLGLLCPGLRSVGQITFEFADLPVAGDVVTRFVDTVPSFGPGQAGAAQVWDMASAVPHVTVNTTVSTAASTPQGASFASSNLAFTNDGATFLYFQASPASLVATGIAGDLIGTGEVLSIPFSPTLLVHQFPRTYGSNFQDNYYFQAIIDGSDFGVHSIRLRHRGDVRDTTDGHGTLITPVGSYDVLRVKTTEFSVDSIWFRLLSFAPWTLLSATVDTTESYSWLAKETKLAVAEMTFDSLGAPGRFVYSSIPPAITTGIAAGGRSLEAALYPVPARDRFTLELGPAAGPVHAEVYTSDGRLKASRMLFGDARHTWDVAGWSPGSYVVRLHGVGTEPRTLRLMLQ